jgi:RND superfamily putative drug exporter
VLLDDDSGFDVDRDCLIGRAPHRSNAVRRGLRPIRIEDRTGAISEAHAEIRCVDGEVLIVDRGSTNGIFMCASGRQAWTRVTPWQLAVWRPGTSVRIGNRVLVLHAPRDGAPR